MKKILSLLVMLVMSMGMFAGTIVFADLGLENGVQYLEPFDGGDFTVTFAGGANDGKYYTTGSGIRVYGGGTMTVAAKEGSITEITVTYANGDSYRPTSADVVNVGTYDPETGVWTGTSGSVVFTRPSGNGHWRIQKVEVTLNGETPPEPPTPQVETVSNIAELNALDDNTEFVMENTSAIVCIWSYNGNTYIQDATGATLIYGTIPDVTYAITDIIPSGWGGTKVTYNGFPEVKNASGFTVAVNHQDVEATPINLGNVSTDDWAKHVVAKSVLITLPGTEPPVDDNTAVFDFDNNYAELYPTFGLSTQNTHDGDFTEPTTTTVNNISITITDNPNLNAQGTNQNRLWSNTPRLRMYGGTMTVTAAAGYNITGISFTNHSSNFNMSTETGELGGATSNRTWTGTANSIVFTINSNTQISNMTVTFVSTSKAQEVTGSYTLTDENGNTITAYPQKLGYMNVPDDLTKRYDVYGVLDFYNGNPQMLPVGFVDDAGVVTKIEDVTVSNIKSVKFYDTMGRISDKPFDGINIVKTEYDNGTVKINKIIK